MWEVLSGRLLYRFPDEREVESVAWSPNGQYLATGSFDDTVSVWQVATSHKVLTYYGHIQSLAVPRISKAGLSEKIESARLHPSAGRGSVIGSLAWSPEVPTCSPAEETAQAWSGRH